MNPIGIAAPVGKPARPKRPIWLWLVSARVFEAGWEKTDLWLSAAALPNVTVLGDDDGLEAQRFGAATSGQTLLYDTRGRMIFSGGITKSRGHKGGNAGTAALVALLGRGDPLSNRTRVFGCPLFASN